MKNNEFLKKQIIYRSIHRGTKEMDLLLGKFVKCHINNFDNNDLNDLLKLLSIEDAILYKWYFEKYPNKEIDSIQISEKLRDFKL